LRSAGAFFFSFFFCRLPLVVQSPCSLTMLFADRRTAILSLQGLPRPNYQP
jgi:hypothetical protein